jgi:hypothetical protein
VRDVYIYIHLRQKALPPPMLHQHNLEAVSIT